MSLTVIELENMEFQAFHGCYELERQVGNRFQVSVRIEAELGEAADSDRTFRRTFSNTSQEGSPAASASGFRKASGFGSRFRKWPLLWAGKSRKSR